MVQEAKSGVEQFGFLDYLTGMKTKAIGWMAVGAAALTLAALPAAAQMTIAAKPDKSYTGTVVSVNPNGGTLKVKGPLMFSKDFNLGQNCAYALWNEPAGTDADLRPGEKVRVRYQDANGVLVADRVQQEPMTEQGMVKTIDPATHTLTLRCGLRDKTVQVPDNCPVKLAGDKSGMVADVQPGYYVTVTYELPNDKAVAKEIDQTGTTFTGDLRAINLDNRTVVAKSIFDTDTFHLADNCAIVINGKTTGQLSDLRLGDRMAFTYEDINGVKVVNRISNEPVTQESETTSAQPIYP